jgi:putative transposase
MEHYRRTAHTRFDIKLHPVWITKYRKKLLRGDVGVRLRQIVRTICAELEVEILKTTISRLRTLEQVVPSRAFSRLTNPPASSRW